MSKPFDISPYIDLSQITDPQMKAEITRTLIYFAKSKGGQALLEAAYRQNREPIHITTNEREKTHFVSDDPPRIPQHLNINREMIAHLRYFTTPALDPNQTAPITLAQVLWHELEHAGRPEVENAEEKQLWNKNLDADAQMRSVAQTEYRAAAGNPILASNIRSFDLGSYQKERLLAEIKGERFPLPEGLPSNLQQAIDLAYRADAEWQKLYDTLEELPVIARTNAAMKKLYPHLPPQYSHNGIFDENHTHPVNSGRLSPADQAKEDANWKAVSELRTTVLKLTVATTPHAGEVALVQDQHRQTVQLD